MKTPKRDYKQDVCPKCGSMVHWYSEEVDNGTGYETVDAYGECINSDCDFGVKGLRDQIERIPDKLMSDTTFKLAVRYGLVTITLSPRVWGWSAVQPLPVGIPHVVPTREGKARGHHQRPKTPLLCCFSAKRMAGRGCGS